MAKGFLINSGSSEFKFTSDTFSVINSGEEYHRYKYILTLDKDYTNAKMILFCYRDASTAQNKYPQIYFTGSGTYNIITYTGSWNNISTKGSGAGVLIINFSGVSGENIHIGISSTKPTSGSYPDYSNVGSGIYYIFE